MLDGEPVPGATPAEAQEPKQDGKGEGMVASYAKQGDTMPDATPENNLNPDKIVERWEGESKGVPAPEGFNPANFDPKKIAERWEGADKKAADSGPTKEKVGDPLTRNGWRGTTPAEAKPVPRATQDVTAKAPTPSISPTNK